MLSIVTQKDNVKLTIDNYFVKKDIVRGVKAHFICTNVDRQTLYIGQYNSEEEAIKVFNEMVNFEENTPSKIFRMPITE